MHNTLELVKEIVRVLLTLVLFVGAVIIPMTLLDDLEFRSYVGATYPKMEIICLRVLSMTGAIFIAYWINKLIWPRKNKQSETEQWPSGKDLWA